jgi:hypothetical protein
VFRRLEEYIEYPRTAGVIDAIVKVMIEVLCILAIATKELKENRAGELILAKICTLSLNLCRNGSEDGYRGCTASA